MSMGSAIASGLTSGGQYSDLNSLPGIHYGAGIWNSADPLNLFGHSGSNIDANLTNPLGSGLINGNIPNNGVNPLEEQRWGATAAPTGLPAPAGQVPGNLYAPTPFQYSPLAGGGAYNAMANALAQGVAPGAYNTQVSSPVPAVPFQAPGPVGPLPFLGRMRAAPNILPYLPRGRLQP